MIRKLLLFTLLGIPELLMAQWGTIGLEAGASRGFLLPHRKNMAHLPEKAAHAADVRIYVQGDGSRAWHGYYEGFETGLQSKVMQLGNADVLGHGVGLAWYFSTPLVRGKWWNWNAEIGAGPGFVTKPFDPDNNFKNIAIGSVGNAYIFTATHLHMQLNPAWYLRAELSFHHFSNASFALPNLGLNYPMLGMKVGYRFHRTAKDATSHVRVDSLPKGGWTLGMEQGLKAYPLPYRSKAPAFVLWMERATRLNQKSSLTLGTDLMYNVALLTYRRALDHELPWWQNAQLGLRGGYTLHIDRMQLFFQTGLYVYDHYRRDGVLYSRVGMRYHFTKCVAVQLSLKTHLFKADYATFGLAYRF